MRPTPRGRRCPPFRERLTCDDDLRRQSAVQRHRAGREDTVRASRQGGFREADQRSGDRQAAGLRFRRDAAERSAGCDPGAQRLPDEWPAAARERGSGAAATSASGRRPVPSLTERPRTVLHEKTPRAAGFFHLFPQGAGHRPHEIAMTTSNKWALLIAVALLI